LKKVCGNGLQRNWFDCRLQWRVGDGKCVKFWEDRWVDGLALKENFPRLYSISRNKDSLVGDLAEWEDKRPSRCTTWNLSWRRERLDWEKNLEEQMIAMISNFKWEARGQDRLVWVKKDLQEYTVKSGYSILNCEDLMQISETFQVLWSLKVAPSALVCAWRLLLDRLPTRSNLARRGVQLESVQCPLCQEHVETAKHLFNTCRVARQVWDMCDRWVGNMVVRHESTSVNFQGYYLLSQRKGVNRVWKGMWVAIVSEIWNLRNKVVFKGEVVDAEEIFCLAQLKV